ncbi:hypothetical protein CQ054_22875 [Ochrobactrum sp. MYb29]|nr:hypothetical protein CQ054_22875 [Ochrobactrum sp. MYb29]
MRCNESIYEMIQDQFPHLIGKRLANFLGVFFYTGNFDLNPTAIYFPVAKSKWIGITSDGNGRFKLFPPLTDLYHIPEVGFNCVAPLSLCITKSESYNSIINDVRYEEADNLSLVVLILSNGMAIKLKSEDDNLIIVEE